MTGVRESGRARQSAINTALINTTLARREAGG